MKNILSKREMSTIEWMAESTFEDLIESCENGISGGIHRIKYKPNNGIFNEKFLKDLLMTNEGDNDYDYELGNSGWDLILDNIDQISKFYLEYIDTFPVVKNYIKNVENGQESINNMKESLKKIIN